MCLYNVGGMVDVGMHLCMGMGVDVVGRNRMYYVRGGSLYVECTSYNNYCMHL